jgi:SecD/SecF fusion protein
VQASSDNSRLGSQYYAFGAPGSDACATAARAQGRAFSPGVHCLLAGPEDNQHDLRSSLKSLGLSLSQGQESEFVIPTGTVVIQAADSKPSDQTPFDDPNAQFYVLKDHVALRGNEITDPQQSTAAGGEPDVTFGFSSNGARAFQRFTSRVARRGEQVSALGLMLNQHFAVALDDKLITVPQIDFKSYPNGISGTDGADIVDGFTIHSARDLATRLRLGALPVALKPS